VFAPFLPFVTEEVWSWWQDGSVHRAKWPTSQEVLAACAPLEVSRGADTGADALAFASAVLGAIRKKKSEEQKPLKTPAARVVVAAPAGQRALLAEVERDLRAAGLIERLESADAETLTVDVELGNAPAPPDRR